MTESAEKVVLEEVTAPIVDEAEGEILELDINPEHLAKLTPEEGRTFVAGALKRQNEMMFVESFEEFAGRIHMEVRANGFWDNPRNDGEMIALMHSELSECLEALRKGDGPCEKVPEITKVEEELADTIIRIMDFAKGRGYDLARAIVLKAAFNTTRGKMHGGKKF